MSQGWFKGISPLVRLLLHLAPLWPLYERRWPLLGAALLFMILPYIKVNKMGGGNPDFSTWPPDKVAAFKRWKLLTFGQKD